MITNYKIQVSPQGPKYLASVLVEVPGGYDPRDQQSYSSWKTVVVVLEKTKNAALRAAVAEWLQTLDDA